MCLPLDPKDNAFLAAALFFVTKPRDIKHVARSPPELAMWPAPQGLLNVSIQSGASQIVRKATYLYLEFTSSGGENPAAYGWLHLVYL